MHDVPRPVALVTGASSGIGRALAVRMARHGHDVALLARRRPELEAAAVEVERAGGRGLPIVCDVSEPGEIRAAVAAAVDALGPVDLLIANAGTPGRRGVGVPAPEVDRVFDVNVRGAVHAVGAVLPAMRARGSGHLVCVSSLAGYGGLPGAAAYSASKAALTTYFEALRVELGGSGIDVTVIAPGWVRTPFIGPETRPFTLDLEPAADRIARAILARRPHLAFPWPLATAVRIARLLPRSLYDRLVRRAVPVPDAPAPGGGPGRSGALSQDHGPT